MRRGEGEGRGGKKKGGRLGKGRKGGEGRRNNGRDDVWKNIYVTTKEGREKRKHE